MAIATSNTVSVASVAATDWVKMRTGINRIYVSCATWGTTSVAYQLSHDADTAYPLESPIGTALTTTTNRCFDVIGPGYVRLNCTAYDANAVTLKVLNPIDDRL